MAISACKAENSAAMSSRVAARGGSDAAAAARAPGLGQKIKQKLYG
jgi:hypothetical protein